ncbi:DUF3164 family protein [Cupriavidus basilensis]
MTKQNDAIPAGYRKDGRGRLVPEAMVKPIDRERDELVCALVDGAKAQRDMLAEFKRAAFKASRSFLDLSAKQYKVQLGGAKGNVTLHSFDGRCKVLIANADTIVFDERLQSAKALIDECIAEWSKGSRPEIQVLVQQAFETDREGKLKTGRVLGLTRLEIKDAKWRRAMKAISESVQVIGTKEYIRFYERSEATGEYLPVTLDIAGV